MKHIFLCFNFQLILANWNSIENLIKDHPDKYRWLSFSCVRDHTLLKHANSNRLVSSRHTKLSSNKRVTQS
jgi:hypothetical protein